MPARRKRRARGEGTLYQRDDGLWVGEVDSRRKGRKRQRTTVYGSSREEAARKLREARTCEKAGGSLLTVSEWLDQWLIDITGTVEPETLRPYKSHCTLHIKPIHGDTLLSDLDADAVQQLYSRLRREKNSPAMIRKVGTTLTVAINHAIRRGLLKANPALAVKKPKAERFEARPLTPEELTRFLAAAKGDRLEAFYLTLIDTGARPGELCALNWPDIDLESRFISITKSLEENSGKLRIKEAKTAKSRRRVDVSFTCIVEITRHRERMASEGQDTDKGIVFPSPRGKHLRRGSVKESSFGPILERAGLTGMRLYDLRHTTATLLLLAGEDTKVVSERLGHSTTVLTSNTYQHVLPQMQRRAAATMNSILERAQESNPPEQQMK